MGISGSQPGFDARIIALSGDFARFFEPGYNLILEKVPWQTRRMSKRRTVCKVTNADGSVEFLRSFAAGYAWAKAWRVAQPTADFISAGEPLKDEMYPGASFIKARKAYQPRRPEVVANPTSETPSRSYSSAAVLAVSPSAIATALKLTEPGTTRCSCSDERRHCKGENGRLIRRVFCGVFGGVPFCR